MKHEIFETSYCVFQSPVVILTVFSGLIDSKGLYRPIARILAMLTGKIGKPSGIWHDEIHRIDDALRTTFDERDLYHRKLEESLPYYREQLKHELLRVPAAPTEQWGKSSQSSRFPSACMS